MGVFADELIKLRRRIGDLYTDAGVEIDSTSVRTTDGTLLKSGELIDCYNNAVNNYLGYLVTTKLKKEWSQYAPGYIVIVNGVTVSANKVNLDGLATIPFRIVNVMKSGGTTIDDIFVEISPDMYFDAKVGTTKSQAKANKYTLMHDGTNWSMFTVTPSAVATVDIVYLKRHANLTSATNAEFDNKFSQSALQSILLFGEMEAKRAISQDIKDSPEARLNSMVQADAMLNKAQK